MITDQDVKALSGPDAKARANGDPDGGLTGTVSDVTIADPVTDKTPKAKGLTMADLANQVGQNKIAINFVWTLVTGFLVMFMQAGFAIVETGLCRAKNANHTMMMNFMVYGVGMLAYWLIGFAIQEGGVGAVANLGASPVLSHEYVITLFGKPFGLWGQGGYFLMHSGAYDVFVMVLFLFQMVFMDTALTIVTGTAAERWKYAAFVVSSFVMGAFTYPLFANWAWGGGWLANLGPISAWATAMRILPDRAWCTRLAASPRWPWASSSDRASASSRATANRLRCRATISWSCCWAASSWPSAGSGSIPARRWALPATAICASARIAVNTMLAGMAGSFGSMLYMWLRYGKPDASMTGNGLLAGLVAITAPSGFVNPVGAVIIGLIAGVLVCLSVEFVERVMKVDDPVGAISVHGTNGLWGVISVGLFADGKSNYGGSWNGVDGSVKGCSTAIPASWWRS